MGATAWACDLEGDPPTALPLADVERALTDAYCDRMFDCTCTQGRRFDDRASCEARIGERVAVLQQELEANDLRYDETCLGALVDVLDDTGCDPAPAGGDDDDDCEATCTPLFGDQPLGEPCVDLTFGSDCAKGLECQYDCDEVDCFERCVDPCGGVCGRCAEDERCATESRECVKLPGIGESCSEYGCAPGGVCRFDEVGSRCVALPGEGDSCTQVGVCAEGLRCVGDPTTGESACAPLPGQGEPCTGHSQCTTGYCPAGFCDTLPEAGESCAGTSACAPGLQCNFETLVCEDADAAVCRTDVPWF